jgi:hypothetical protein
MKTFLCDVRSVSIYLLKSHRRKVHFPSFVISNMIIFPCLDFRVRTSDLLELRMIFFNIIVVDVCNHVLLLNLNYSIDLYISERLYSLLTTYLVHIFTQCRAIHSLFMQKKLFSKTAITVRMRKERKKQHNKKQARGKDEE